MQDRPTLQVCAAILYRHISKVSGVSIPLNHGDDGFECLPMPFSSYSE